MAIKSYNIKTDFGAANAKGDGQFTTTNCTIASGTPTRLDVLAAGTFNSGDNGKWIQIPGAGAGGAAGDPLEATITFVSGTRVTLSVAASTFLSAVSTLIEWGTDDSGAFDAFNSQAKTYQASNPADTIELTVPAGRYIFANAGATAAEAFFGGIRNLTILGASAATTFFTVLVRAGFTLGAKSGLHSTNQPGLGFFPGSRTAAAAIGATSVTLLTPAENSRFAVGDVALMSGIDIQGQGQPQNFQFFEYVTVTGKSTVSTTNDTINFTPALAYSYKTTWPVYQIGDTSEPDLGGPATLFPATPDWQKTISEFRDLTINALYRQVLYKARSATLLRVNALGTLGIIISQQAVFNWTDSQALAENMEVDKICGTCNLTNLTINSMGFQSPAITYLTCDTCTIGSMAGTALNTTLTNCTITNLRLGTISYGASLTTTINGGTVSGTFDAAGGTPISAPLMALYTMTGGVIHLDTALAPPGLTGFPAWPMPGSTLTWQSQYDSERTFRVLDITNPSGTLNDVTTTWPNGFPAPQGVASLSARVHPAPNINFNSVSGHEAFEYLCLLGAKNKPIYSYARRTYTTLNGDAPAPLIVWGELVSMVIDVSGHASGAIDLRPTGQFLNYPTIMPDQSMVPYAPVINLSQNGVRVIRPSGVTTDGVPGFSNGDANLDLPNASTWFTGAMKPFTTANMAGITVTIEVITNQGIVSPLTNTAVMPLMYRVHA